MPFLICRKSKFRDEIEFLEDVYEKKKEARDLIEILSEQHPGWDYVAIDLDKTPGIQKMTLTPEEARAAGLEVGKAKGVKMN